MVQGVLPIFMKSWALKRNMKRRRMTASEIDGSCRCEQLSVLLRSYNNIHDHSRKSTRYKPFASLLSISHLTKSIMQPSILLTALAGVIPLVTATRKVEGYIGAACTSARIFDFFDPTGCVDISQYEAPRSIAIGGLANGTTIIFLDGDCNGGNEVYATHSTEAVCYLVPEDTTVKSFAVFTQLG